MPSAHCSRLPHLEEWKTRKATASHRKIGVLKYLCNVNYVSLVFSISFSQIRYCFAIIPAAIEFDPLGLFHIYGGLDYYCKNPVVLKFLRLKSIVRSAHFFPNLLRLSWLDLSSA